MQAAELIALLTGSVLALNVRVLALTCMERPGRWLTAVRAALPAVGVGLLALAFDAPSAPLVRALAAVSFALAILALAIDLTALRAEPAWWSSFESSFWRYVAHGALDESH